MTSCLVNLGAAAFTRRCSFRLSRRARFSGDTGSGIGGSSTISRSGEVFSPFSRSFSICFSLAAVRFGVPGTGPGYHHGSAGWGSLAGLPWTSRSYLLAPAVPIPSLWLAASRLKHRHDWVPGQRGPLLSLGFYASVGDGTSIRVQLCEST